MNHGSKRRNIDGSDLMLFINNEEVALPNDIRKTPHKAVIDMYKRKNGAAWQEVWKNDHVLVVHWGEWGRGFIKNPGYVTWQAYG